MSLSKQELASDFTPRSPPAEQSLPPMEAEAWCVFSGDGNTAVSGLEGDRKSKAGVPLCTENGGKGFIGKFMRRIVETLSLLLPTKFQNPGSGCHFCQEGSCKRLLSEVRKGYSKQSCTVGTSGEIMEGASENTWPHLWGTWGEHLRFCTFLTGDQKTLRSFKQGKIN